MRFILQFLEERLFGSYGYRLLALTNRHCMLLQRRAYRRSRRRSRLHLFGLNQQEEPPSRVVTDPVKGGGGGGGTSYVASACLLFSVSSICPYAFPKGACSVEGDGCRLHLISGSWFGYPAHANQAFYLTRVGELVPDLGRIKS